MATKTPIIFLVFNRPELTSRVFARIREAEPEKLIVVADGPRLDRVGEAEKCRQVRELIDKGVDWPCAVVRDYSEVNLGCGRRVSSGITRAFEHVDEAIILEDDCLPDPVFFSFCKELLARYRDERRVGAISGDNFQPKDMTDGRGYYFSRYTHCWGWATWRRAWQPYDYAIADWPERKRSRWLHSLFKSAGETTYWERMFDRVYCNKIDTWDYQWAYANWKVDSLTVLPSANLVSNIGFGPLATHTREVASQISLGCRRQLWPLRHPIFIQNNEAADWYTYVHHFNPPFWLRAWRMLRRLQ